MYFIKDGVHFFSLPGVPQEMKDLITSAVIPALERSFERPAILHRTIVTAGMGESMVAERLVDFEKSMPEHISLAYLPSYGMVKLRLTAIGEDKNSVESSLQVQFDKLKTTLQDIAISDQDEPIEKTVASLLRKNRKTIGTAESCTGGAIAALITSAPGSSAYFKGSIVSYANEIKINSLKVLPLTIEQYGAVSEQVVVEMAKGALQELNTDYAIATSGIMGPDGGTAEKPVGTIWIAVASNKNIRTHLLQLRFNRARNTSITVSNALIQLRKLILEESNS
jgi:nicotinamide-nucleotide amidase